MGVELARVVPAHKFACLPILWQAQKPRYLLYPAQKLCIEKALKFVPKLEEAHNLQSKKSQKPGGADDDVVPPEPEFNSDDDL